MAARTRSRVCGRVARVPFKTCDTVAIDTPAFAATSLMLALKTVSPPLAKWSASAAAHRSDRRQFKRLRAVFSTGVQEFLSLGGSGGLSNDAVGENFFDGDFEDTFDLVEFDGRVAGKDGLDGSFDVGVQFEVRGFGVREASAGFVELGYLRASASFCRFLRFKANLCFSLFSALSFSRSDRHLWKARSWVVW